MGESRCPVMNMSLVTLRVLASLPVKSVIVMKSCPEDSSCCRILSINRISGSTPQNTSNLLIFWKSVVVWCIMTWSNQLNIATPAVYIFVLWKVSIVDGMGGRDGGWTKGSKHGWSFDTSSVKWLTSGKMIPIFHIDYIYIYTVLYTYIDIYVFNGSCSVKSTDPNVIWLESMEFQGLILYWGLQICFHAKTTT